MMPKPVTFAPIPGRPLLVLSCSEVKRPAPAGAWLRFIELYDGPMWRQVRAAGFPSANVVAISALYGVLDPGMPIQTYDAVMDEKRSARHCSTGCSVARLARHIRAAGAAFVVGGGLYQELARTAVRLDPELAELVRFASGSYLQQRKQLGEFLRGASGGLFSDDAKQIDLLDLMRPTMCVNTDGSPA